MNKIIIKAGSIGEIAFHPYLRKAPKTIAAFSKAIPFSASAVQARFAGEEIWLPKGPKLLIQKENSTNYPKFGELGIAPFGKSDISRSIAIIYGEAKLSGQVNIFAKVAIKDRQKLKKLGKLIWLKGTRKIKFTLG